LRYLFFALIVKPVTFVLLGINVKNRELLIKKGPAIIIANHNSHLDTMILMGLFPLRLLKYLRPIAAADYFLRNWFIRWFSVGIIGIVPIARTRSSASDDLLAPVSKALQEGSMVIFFPEGTRGDPEEMQQFKSGIARLAERHPDVPICPFFLYGAGRALPKDEGILVPFIVDIAVGEAFYYSGDKSSFMAQVEQRMGTLKAQVSVSNWK
jgi:1-acyl-sn-glycerol-3-phosphate acyltransferase